MKKFTKSALATAVVLGASGYASAGEIGCLEVYKGEIDNYFATPYTPATCNYDASGNASATALLTLAPVKIAAELTGSLPVEFDDFKNDGSGNELQVVYTPTSEVTPNTVLTFELDNAEFFGNSGRIHLVKADTSLDASGNIVLAETFSSVGSTDGTVDGASSITFRANSTIAAGTRLALSRVASGSLDVDSSGNTYADASGNLDVQIIGSGDLEQIGVRLANANCVNPRLSGTSVGLQVTSAVSNNSNSQSIAGAITDKQTLIDTSAQFIAFDGFALTTDAVVGQVNAESPNGFTRAEFVASDEKANADQVFAKVTFTDKEADLDRAIDIDASGNGYNLDTKFITTKDANNGTELVQAAIFDASGNVPSLTQINVSSGSAFGTFSSDAMTAVTYETPADDLFDSSGNTVMYVVQNNDPLSPNQVAMNFNYDVNVHHALNFNDNTLRDHCEYTPQSHDIDINGAQLKLAFAAENRAQWIRITNEDSEDAEVTMDIFDESGNFTAAVSVADVSGQSSTLYMIDDLVTTAKANPGDNYGGTGEFHTMTFTVTAPNDSVHGNSVQRSPSGVDRVIPVLRSTTDADDNVVWQE